jgi:hypothetical protein
MLPEVEKHVPESVVRLSRRHDDLSVVTAGEYCATPTRSWPALADRCIQVLGSRDLKSLHPCSECRLVIRFHEQVNVRALDTGVNDPEVVAPHRRDRGFADRVIRAATAQTADGVHRSQCDVDGMPGVQKRPRLVRRSSPGAFRRSTRTAALAASLLARCEQPQLRRFSLALARLPTPVTSHGF